MSDNPSKLTVPVLEETNFPTWCPAMEARLRQPSVFHIITGKRTEPEEPDYAVPTPTGGTATTPIAAISLTREERVLHAQLKAAYECEQNEFCDCQVSYLQRTHVADHHNGPAKMGATIKAVHVQQVPGMRFSAYNDLLSIVNYSQ
jgi:hypothetical protein